MVRSVKHYFLFSVAVCIAPLSALPAAQAFPLEDDQTVGTMAVNFRRQSNIWSQWDLGFVDAQVKSSPPDAVKFDRRLESLAIIGGEAGIAKRWGLRVNVKAEYSRRKEAEQDAPRAVVESTRKTYTPSVDATFVTDKGLELFAGVAAQQTQPYTETVTSSAASSQTAFDRSLLLARRFGVVRRSAAWTGGFYYVLGVEKDRGFRQSASDGSELRGQETVFIPSRMGVFGQFGVMGSTCDLELNFVQARGMGPSDSRGVTVYTDYFEARASSYVEFGSGIGLKLGGAYKTLSYASNAFVSLDTMPVESVRLLMIFGKLEAHAFAGVIGSYGKDGQSLPELNAQYKLTAFAATSGFIFPL